MGIFVMGSKAMPRTVIWISMGPLLLSSWKKGSSFSYVASRYSGITLVSASTGMKLVSPAQRGTT